MILQWDMDSWGILDPTRGPKALLPLEMEPSTTPPGLARTQNACWAEGSVDEGGLYEPWENIAATQRWFAFEHCGTFFEPLKHWNEKDMMSMLSDYIQYTTVLLSIGYISPFFPHLTTGTK